MSDYMELPVGNEEFLRVEVGTEGLVRAGAGEMLGRAGERFDEVLSQVINLGRDTVQRARTAAEPPDSIEVELGIKLTAKTGFVVAESSGEAQFKVILRWSSEKPER